MQHKNKEVGGEILFKGKAIKKHIMLQIRPHNQQTFMKQTDDIKKKTIEFIQQYPTYVSEGHIIFPIYDEYLHAY